MKININKEPISKEEKANFLSHGFGLLLSLLGLFFLIINAISIGSGWNLICCVTYGFTLVLLFASSSVYHYLTSKKWKLFFNRIDHMCIYLLIAGSYTPFALINMRDNFGWPLFYAIWSLAICGFILKIFFFGKFERFSIILYLVMGWLVVFAVKPLFNSIELGGFLWLMIGGVAYTSGVFFFVMDRKPYYHAIWHVFVLCGSFCHYISILFYVLPLT